MTASQDKILEKWGAILDGQIKALELDHQNHWAPISASYTCGVDPCYKGEDFSSLFPIVMRVNAQTIGLDLVNVQPLGGLSNEELERIKGEVIQENRDRAIDSVLDDQEFKPMKVEEHPDYNIGAPKGQSFYLDYKYNSGTASNEI